MTLYFQLFDPPHPPPTVSLYSMPTNQITAHSFAVKRDVIVSQHHSRRIYTEEKTKVVAAVWGTEFIQFLAALPILHWEDFGE